MVPFCSDLAEIVGVQSSKLQAPKNPQTPNHEHEVANSKRQTSKEYHTPNIKLLAARMPATTQSSANGQLDFGPSSFLGAWNFEL
jgi:hypothetical protein